MKKKLEDVTLKELKRFCRSTEDCMGNCPLFEWSSNDVYCSMYLPGTLAPNVLEQEVEIPDEPVGNPDKLEEEDE